MSVSREDVMGALQTALTGLSITLPENQGGATFTLKFVARRVRDPENVDSSDRPCIYLVEHIDNWESQALDVPSVRIMNVWALLYIDTGTNENLVPMTQVNLFIEQMEATFDPDNGSGATLAGYVRSVKLAGEGVRAAGDTTGKMFAAIPINIVIP